MGNDCLSVLDTAYPCRKWQKRIAPMPTRFSSSSACIHVLCKLLHPLVGVGAVCKLTGKLVCPVPFSIASCKLVCPLISRALQRPAAISQHSFYDIYSNLLPAIKVPNRRCYLRFSCVLVRALIHGQHPFTWSHKGRIPWGITVVVKRVSSIRLLSVPALMHITALMHATACMQATALNVCNCPECMQMP